MRAHVALDDLHDGDVGQQVVHHALERHERAREHGDRARKLDAILLRHGDDRVHEGADVEVREVRGAVVGDDGVEVGEQVRLVDVGHAGDREAHEAVGEGGRVAPAHGEHHVAHGAAVVGGEPPHDAEVHVDDLALVDHEVARVRVGVEEAVVEHLGGVVVGELGADLGEVVALGDEARRVVDGDSIDEVHDHDVARAERGIGLGAVDEATVGVVAAELLEAARLDEEVRLLAERLPELVHHRLQVDELVLAHEAARVARERPHDRDVLRHDLFDVRALDLHGDELAGHEARLVHLRHGRRAQRAVVDGVEDLLERGLVLGAQGLDHGRVVHGHHARPKAGELPREVLGKDLGAHGEDLARLDEGGAELLEHAAQALGREAVEDVVAPHDLDHLADAGEAGGGRELVVVRAGGAAAEQADRLGGLAPRLALLHGGIPGVENLLGRLGGGGHLATRELGALHGPPGAALLRGRDRGRGARRGVGGGNGIGRGARVLLVPRSPLGARGVKRGRALAAAPVVVLSCVGHATPYSASSSASSSSASTSTVTACASMSAAISATLAA